jgi:hypothetical protein
MLFCAEKLNLPGRITGPRVFWFRQTLRTFTGRERAHFFTDVVVSNRFIHSGVVPAGTRLAATGNR